MDALKQILQTFWIGGLWCVGVLVAPALFHTMARPEAGMLAGVIFTWMAWAGIACGSFLLIHAGWKQGFRVVQSLAFWLVLAMLACTIVNHFAVSPIIVQLKSGASQVALGMFGGGFSTWHTISSLIYLAQCVLGLLLVLKDSGNSR